MGQFDVAVHARARGLARFSRWRIAAALAVAAAVAVVVPLKMAERVVASEAAVDDDELGQILLVVSDDHRTLEFTGPIAFGVTRRVRAVLDAYPSITTLRLTSPGGRVVEARDLSALIARRGLTTVAVDNCASACTVLFMAGEERLLAPTSTLGFHRYRSPDPRQEEAEQNMAIDRRYFEARGLPSWFIDRAFTTPNGGMWRPSLDEMKVANVITGELASDGRRVAVRLANPVVLPSAGEPSAGDLSVRASESPQ